MRALRELAGTLVMTAAVVLASVSIYEVVRASECGAPPGPVALRTCSDDLGQGLLLLLLAIFVLAPAGALLVRRLALVLTGWWVIWTAMGAAALVGGHGPAAPPGAQAAGDGVGITFLVIGVLSLLGHLLVAASQRGGPPPLAVDDAPGADEADAELAELAALEAAAIRDDPGDGDVASRLRRLGELHAGGLITDAELAARRGEILDEL